MPIDGTLRGKVDLICYDFDGVMTDNRALILENGQEGVFVSRSDGWAISRIRQLPIPQVIISTETNPVVEARARKLKIPVVQGTNDKLRSLTKLMDQEDYAWDRTVFVGNDLNDLEVMKRVGYPIAPKDAHPKISALAFYVTQAVGGAGVIRELHDCFFAVAEEK